MCLDQLGSHLLHGIKTRKPPIIDDLNDWWCSRQTDRRGFILFFVYPTAAMHLLILVILVFCLILIDLLRFPLCPPGLKTPDNYHLADRPPLHFLTPRPRRSPCSAPLLLGNFSTVFLNILDINRATRPRLPMWVTVPVFGMCLKRQARTTQQNMLQYLVR